MSVPVHERKESELSFLVKAEKLQYLTNQIVMNDKYVPKRYRYIWTQEVFKLAINIFEDARRSNIIYPKTKMEYDRRTELLINAETNAEALLSQIAFAREVFNIPNGLLKEWESTCISTKRTMRKRRNEDAERFKF